MMNVKTNIMSKLEDIKGALVVYLVFLEALIVHGAYTIYDKIFMKNNEIT